MPARTRTRKAPAKKKPARKTAASRALTRTPREAEGRNRDRALTKRWTLSVQDEHAVAQGCWFDEEAAERAALFFPAVLRHTMGELAGMPFDLLPWQETPIRQLYGWKTRDNLRRFRDLSIWIAKKNGKSTTGSGLALLNLTHDNEARPEVYLAAADKEQAGIVYREAVQMVRASPVLSQMLEVVESTKRILFRDAGGFMRVLSGEAFSSEGINASAVNFDELHAQPDRRLWDALRYAGAARRQPITVSQSTAGVYNKETIGWEQYEYAKAVLAGDKVDVSFLPVVYEAAPEDPIDEPATWRKANPSLGVTMSEAGFARDVAEARNNPRKLNAFLRYRLNIWVNQETRWLNMEEWDRCAGPAGACDEQALRGRSCVVGLDLSQSRDITAAVAVFPPKAKGEQAKVLPAFFIPEDSLAQRVQRDRVPYDLWRDQGLVHVTPGNAVDYGYVERHILRWAEVFNVLEVAADPYNAMATSHRLMEEGLEVTFVRQQFSALSSACKALEGMVADGKIAHGGNAVLRWMANNVAVKEDDAGNIRPIKKHSRERIDGISALVTALARMLVVEDDPKEAFVW